MSDLIELMDTNNESVKKMRRKNEFLIRDVFTALAVCHNVTPLIENGEKAFQASSPDELALVKFADFLNMKLMERDE
jgi:phospholipid-translocating ATPase